MSTGELMVHPPVTRVPRSDLEAVVYVTKNDISAATRANMIELLNARLADAVDLTTQAKQAHWNVKGPSFIALHELFDRVAGAVEESADLIAERAVQLGGIAAGTACVAAKRSSLPEYPLAIACGTEHVDALSAALATFGKLVRRAIAEAAEAGDQGPADLFTEVSGAADKQLWFVEAHGQAGR